MTRAIRFDDKPDKPTTHAPTAPPMGADPHAVYSSTGERLGFVSDISFTTTVEAYDVTSHYADDATFIKGLTKHRATVTLRVTEHELNNLLRVMREY